LSTSLPSLHDALPISGRTLRDFVSVEWEPVELPTLKYATQLFYRHMIHVHLLPAFGAYRLSDISREAIQTFLNKKLESGLSWKRSEEHTSELQSPDHL